MSNIIIPGRRTFDLGRIAQLTRLAKPYDVQYEAERTRHRLATERTLERLGFMAQARGIVARARQSYPQFAGAMAAQTNQWIEPIWTNNADGPTQSSASEIALLAAGQQPSLWANFFASQSGRGKLVTLKAKGVLTTTTGPPSMTWFVRLGTAINVITGTIIAQSASITTVASQTNVYWELVCDIILNTPGIGANQATITSGGTVRSPKGFVSPFEYAMEQAAPDTATWTTTLDGSAAQYLMVSANPGSASDSITLKELLVLATTQA